MASTGTDSEPSAGEIGLMRETVTVEIGARHLDDLVTIVDPLVVTDLATLLWSPHGHPEAVDEVNVALRNFDECAVVGDKAIARGAAEIESEFVHVSVDLAMELQAIVNAIQSVRETE